MRLRNARMVDLATGVSDRPRDIVISGSRIYRSDVSTTGAGDDGADEGCIWVLRQDSRIAAVQYSGTGAMDTALRDSIEQSLALTV